MQIYKTIIRLIILCFPLATIAQSTYLLQGSKDYIFADRLEIKQQRNTHLNFSTLKPFSRRALVREIEYLDSARLGYQDSLTGLDKYREWTDLNLTRIDEYNLRSVLMNNAEWVTGPKDDFQSKTPILKNFYRTKPNLFEVNTKDFFLAVNPVLQVQQAIEPGYDQTIFLNSRGITARGMIAERVGFSAFISENQERGPRFVQNYIDKNNAVPGAGFYKKFKNSGVDYFDARGYITFNAAKYIDFQFGYDKNFIGNGYRSLFLSDFGNSNLFLKINTRIWKLNFQNLFMELMPQFRKAGDTLLDRKYAAIHHLSVNVTNWLNIGLFEGVVFGRKNHFDFQYLNPVIFYRHIEGTVGSPDNALAGADFKANIGHTVQLYGQFLLDEFILKEITKGTGFWANKYGIQGGIKYVDAFGLNNLDIQLEGNRVRPFTYSHNSKTANYTHYNQPLAHPLGANFQEWLLLMRFQPAPRWYINAKAIYYNQGLDSVGLNFGGDPFQDNRTRVRESGFEIGSGSKATCLNTSFLVSYEVRENIFLDVSAMYRNYKIKNIPGQSQTTLVTFGLRMNMFRREYDF